VSRTPARPAALALADLEGNALQLRPYAEPASWLVPQRAPGRAAPVGHPRKLGHVNFLTARIQEQKDFYVDALGMRLTDWLGDGGVWLHVNPDTTSWRWSTRATRTSTIWPSTWSTSGQMRDALDHLGRHGGGSAGDPPATAWAATSPPTCRIVEEACFVELYCDMELLAPDHEPRV
jgi:hypothetical protein